MSAVDKPSDNEKKLQPPSSPAGEIDLGSNSREEEEVEAGAALPRAWPAPGESPTNESESSLAGMSARVIEGLIRKSPETIPDVDPSLHYLAPHIPKRAWTALGNLVAERERCTLQYKIDGEHWISLRLDGSGFSRAVKALRKLEVLEPEGFSYKFADCMQASLVHLMEEFHAVLGFTQSDEMIVFVKPTSVVRGERQAHFYNGRVQKMSTLASGLVTAKFLTQLGRLCFREGKDMEALAQVLPHFDCRVGHYESWDEIRALLLWRAYDCSVNSVSDAVYHTTGSDKKTMDKGTQEKVSWLASRELLPLPQHQAYGHLLARVRKEVQGYNPKTKTEVTTMRQVIKTLPGPVLERFRDASFADPSMVMNPEH